MEAAGDLDVFLERYAVVVCSDHGQTRVEEAVRLEEQYADLRVFAGRSKRRSFSLRGGDHSLEPGGNDLPASGLPGRTHGSSPRGSTGSTEPTSSCSARRRFAVARREGEELRFAPDGGGWRLEGDGDLLDADRYPNGLERAWCALACPNAGEVIVSAGEGVEFVDLGGQAHVGGGSHGSLLAGDSLVPMLAAGFDEPPLGAVATDDRPRAAHAGPLRHRPARFDAGARPCRRLTAPGTGAAW